MRSQCPRLVRTLVEILAMRIVPYWPVVIALAVACDSKSPLDLRVRITNGALVLTSRDSVVVSECIVTINGEWETRGVELPPSTDIVLPLSDFTGNKGARFN